jgi:hypothetical protein
MACRQSVARHSGPRRDSCRLLPLESCGPAVDESRNRLSPQREGVDGQYVVQLFRWIKQHLRIKAFYGTTENAVKTQIWIAVSVYVLVAIIRKRLGLDVTLCFTKFYRFSASPYLRKRPFYGHFKHADPKRIQHRRATN